MDDEVRSSWQPALPRFLSVLTSRDSLVFGLAGDLYKLRQGDARAAANRSLLHGGGKAFDAALDRRREEARAELRAWAPVRRALLLDCAKNAADMPVAVEGTFDLRVLNAGKIAACGIASSAVGLYIGWPSKK